MKSVGLSQGLASVQSLTVLITGAAQGMGEIFARRAAQEGAKRLILWDINEPLLQRLTDQLRDRYPRLQVEAAPVDLCDPEQIRRAAAQVLAGGTPQVLINNAGVVTGKPFIAHEATQVVQTMQVNTLAPMLLSLELLPAMSALGEPARILTIASAAAFVSNPNMSVYAASKAAAMSWSDSVRLELQRVPGNQVRVTTFCPTYVSTGMFAGAKKMLLTPIMKPVEVTNRAWEAMLAGSPLVLMPWTARLGQFLRGVLPRPVWDFLAQHVLGIYRSMDQFSGRDAVGSNDRRPDAVR